MSGGGAERSRGARARWSDEEVDQFLGTLLRAGVLIAAAVALAGGLLYLARYGLQPAPRRIFHGEPAALTSVAGIVRGAFALHSEYVIQLGLVLLIATPVARVAFSLVAFAIQRDRVYVLITSIVLALLLFSLFSGTAG